MRLGKYLAHAGVASRRHSEDVVRAGRVAVDGDVVLDPATPVDEHSNVEVDGRLVRPQGRHAVVMLHKPKGVVSTAQDTHGRPTVVDLVEAGERRLYPVGRLDADTTGLILLTDDGELAERLTHPRYEVPKTYVAKVGGPPVHDKALRRLRQGVELDDGPTLPAKVRRLTPHAIELQITEGRKRQVRRMCEEVGHPVQELQRVAIGPLRLGRLKVGDSRELTPDEERALRAAPKAQRRRRPPAR
ncbi:pseudouridine synthase [Conexibacter sp. SYSU D00693]|uniref:pseudouridine synthase n=1 Tax=Conexibacter sp. SYSU D00693 TaxID=2812560 RepID=UPI00196AF76B|nr:pseudouridine synthase [Conexibacter sp. SYSU D00693]